MRIIVLVLCVIFSTSLFAQTQIYNKMELSYEFVEFYDDTTHIGTIKTHINLDFYESGYFMSFSCGTERVYHFLYPNSSVYDINRLTFKQTNMDYVYSCDFKLFDDSVGVYVDKKSTRIINKDYKQIILHN